MSENVRPARLVPPGRILERELEERGWTQRDLANIMNRPPQAINEIIRGTKQITPETALELAAALGTSPEFWIELESKYRLRLAEKNQKGDNGSISRRSQLFSLAPVAELLRRHWIPESDDLAVLERGVCNFMQILSLDERPSLKANFRHSSDRGPEYTAKVAWVRRVEQLSLKQTIRPFDRALFQQNIHKIYALARTEEQIAQVPLALHELGIHFVVVPHLTHTYIDGALCYINDQPIIALSLRYDRIDSFWFTLMHEVAHLALGHHDLHLDNFDDKEEAQNAYEQEANKRARTWLIDQQKLKRFVRTTDPYFSRTKIVSFAETQHVHPGIVVGQLHYDETIPYSHLRGLLPKVSPHLTKWIDQ